ncbi:class III lanthionine synthetase LanKC [Glycomyces sp. TRM65418]|uniref:class III lanthionine synthetase LanKC n=1 Tax=Glycomyces sp. TRM65418 TaxID=2867006 RepID=UPI001CE4D51F|nr:class III lanthionine synthetase LanKC [Glycomyces sp. TRM65418]MCC3763172.1 class III lanthionine synthetase LanKC [Glycomyces sp. TRM65418]QZD57177.1 class III lanthionine synthetase LanKC [Glycomyces sp. TRM65418]
MDDRYAAFCMADPAFYDAMYSAETAGESFAVAERPLPEGWRRSESDDWLTVRHEATALPMQGWKIHASATMDGAERVLEKVWDYCVPRGIQFKFLRSSSALLVRVSKYAPRGYSGKLVTIYPEDDAACERILTELGTLLEGEAGPYILSDLRWGKGPLHVRYGAFANRYTTDERGEVVPALEDGEGRLVADRRDPVFHVPEWVELPAFLRPHLEARGAVKVDEIPFTIERVLHFSNGGGIYLARDAEGRQAVLKEGRPHAGLDTWGHDAVQRVEHEHEVLRRLAGVPGVPEERGLFWLGEHRFLAMEYVEGDVLSKAVVTRYPLVDADATAADYAAFTEWAVDVHAQITAIVEQIHERGLSYGDLHLFNVMIRPDGRAYLLDFEVAGEVDAERRAGLGNQGFAAPRAQTGATADRYSLACMKLALFLPMTNLLGLHRLKARHFAQIIQERFPVPDGWLDDAVDLIAPPEYDYDAPRTDPDAWPAMREEIRRAIVAAATPERDDRLFPGDIQQFESGGLGLAYGAAGVLVALQAAGAERSERFERWLVQRSIDPAAGSRLGLYDGLSGAAFALDRLGHHQAALDTVDVVLGEDWKSLGGDLFGGLSGIGLNLLHLAETRDEPDLTELGLTCAELVADRLDAETAGGPSSGGRNPWAGLMRGGAGRAMLLMRAFDATGDTAFLDAAAAGLRADLGRSVVRSNGSREIDEGWRTMPYLEAGSVGLGIALDAYLAYRPDPEFAEAAEQVALAARSPMYILPGLFTGRAGILLYLAGRSERPAHDPLVREQVRALAWHALPYGEGMAFPGTGLLRLSMDLATGSAGVLLALAAALGDDPRAGLPLIGSTAAPQTPAPRALVNPVSR